MCVCVRVHVCVLFRPLVFARMTKRLLSRLDSVESVCACVCVCMCVRVHACVCVLSVCVSLCGNFQVNFISSP